MRLMRRFSLFVLVLTLWAGTADAQVKVTPPTGGAGGGGGGTWGTILGTITDQTDLVTLVGTKQPLDADLTAIAALTTTSYGRGVLDRADASAMRTYIGTVIGTDVQAQDADLAAIALLTTTSYGRSYLALADAAAARTLTGSVIGTNVQAWDADLDAIAAVASQTSYGRNFLPLTNAAGARTYIGTVIGTDVEAWDADLDSIAALSTTSFGRSLLTQVAATNARTTLGLVIGTDVQAPATTLAGYNISDAQLNINGVKESTHTVAIRNGNNAEFFYVYGYYVDASNYNRLRIGSAASNILSVLQERAGTGPDQNLRFGTNSTAAVTLVTNGGDRLEIDVSGNFNPLGSSGSKNLANSPTGRWGTANIATVDGTAFNFGGTTTAGTSGKTGSTCSAFIAGGCTTSPEPTVYVTEFLVPMITDAGFHVPTFSEWMTLNNRVTSLEQRLAAYEKR